jgi:F-type H+-transporting ATPase subunit b
MENLGIDVNLLIAQIFNFVVFLFIFKKFVAKPFMHFLKNQKEKEAEKEALEQQIKEKEESWKAEEVKLRTLFNKEKAAMIKEASEEASQLKADLIAKAKEEVAQLKDKAKNEIEAERKNAEKDLEQKIIDLSVAIVENTFKNYLSLSMRKEITEQMLKNLNKGN